MPTQHVEPQSAQHLDHVSNSLLRARRVVVITGAGISTNSGIPDFRSENGLYSLVQAQFDAAARLERRVEAAASAGDCHGRDDYRATKRRKICRQDSTTCPDDGPARAKQESPASLDPEHSPSIRHKTPEEGEAVASQPEDFAGKDGQLFSTPQSKLAVMSTADEDFAGKAGQLFSTPQSKLAVMSTADITTSPLSSPPADDLIVPPSHLRTPTHKRLIDASLPLSSSPLSSPPPMLFDSFMSSSPFAAVSSRPSSTSISEMDGYLSTSNLVTSWQTSNSSKSTLPNMKGRDLFDATIWSDPIRTSVFYTFATSLRQKIKTAEPSSSHRFISHLRDRGKLVRCYTQNIDQIEEKVGLSTRLHDGPGSRGRFSRRTTATANQLNKMVDEAAADEPAKSEKQNHSDDASGCDASQPWESSDRSGVSGPGGESTNADQQKPPTRPQKRDPPHSGVECVFLHGSLELLRCFLCAKVCSWDDDEREAETLTGQQPECPHCVGATAAREEMGKRALGVGKLRPDIVLYGEEHPSSHLISPIVTHDLALHPDMLLILGTSLRVHGLKVMVKEFAKAVHSKGGKVVFVNLTKPPESSWGDVIDYWVQWDCDAWVADLQSRIPKLWQDPDLPRPKKKRDSCGAIESEQREEKRRQPVANPVALRDTRATGAYWTAKVLQELARITGKTLPARRASMGAGETIGQPLQRPGEHSSKPRRKKIKAKPRPSRKSASGALKKSTQAPSMLNPKHGRSKKKSGEAAGAAGATVDNKAAISSILNSVKENPRIRKRKVIDGEEVAAPEVPRRRERDASHLKLPPLRSPPAPQSTLPYLFGRPEPLEPRSPPSGPLASLSPNLRNTKMFRAKPLYLEGSMVHLVDSTRRCSSIWGHGEGGAAAAWRR